MHRYPAALITVLATLLITSSARAGYSDMIQATPGLVSYYRMDETATKARDRQGRNDGTYEGGVKQSETGLIIGDSNPAASFDGLDDNLVIDNHSSFKNEDGYSLEAWVKQDRLPAANQWQIPVAKANAYYLGIFNGSGYEVGFAQSNQWVLKGAPTGPFKASTIYHLVSTYDGSTLRMYVNGVLLDSTPITGKVAASSLPLFIGSLDGDNSFFEGVIDEVAVYNRAINDTEVMQHYWEGATGGNVTEQSGALRLNTNQSLDQKLSVVVFNDSYVFTSAEYPIGAGNDCSASETDAKQVTCPAANIQSFEINSGSGNDSILIRAELPALIRSGAGNDTISTGLGADNIFSGSGDDIIKSGEGNDYVASGPGQDDVETDSGNDVILEAAGSDTIDGGRGRDKVSYADRTGRVFVSLDGKANDGETGEQDNLEKGVEAITGGLGDDLLRGNKYDNSLNGLAGNDKLYGGAGNDRLKPGSGRDLLKGGTDFDRAIYTERTNRVTLSLDNRANDGESGERDKIADDVEGLAGGQGADTLTGNSLYNWLSGGPGNDLLTSLGGGDFIHPDGGSNRVRARNGSQELIICTKDDKVAADRNDRLTCR